MKKNIITTVIAITTVLNFSYTQKKYGNLTNFNKIEIKGINGSVDISAGLDFSIEIKGTDLSEDLIKVEVLPEQTLVIKLKKDVSWDYMKNFNLFIKISLPKITKLYNSSNANVTLNNFNGNYFKLENNGNGDVFVEGNTVDTLEIENNGNGDCNFKRLDAMGINVLKNGNGNVTFKTNNNFTATLSGNGDVVNYGKGKALIQKQSGNGKIVYRF